jgi:hypothetical protein
MPDEKTTNKALPSDDLLNTGDDSIELDETEQDSVSGGDTTLMGGVPIRIKQDP